MFKRGNKEKNRKTKAKQNAPKAPKLDLEKAPKACHTPVDLDSITQKAADYHPGTQEWLFDEVKNWASDVSGEKQIFLIEAPAGYGKSVFMSQLARRCFPKLRNQIPEAERAEQVCKIGAIYFFSKFDLIRANVKTLIRELSDQLRETVPGFTKQLVKQPKILLRGTNNDTTELNEFYLRKLTVEDLFEVLIGKPCFALDSKRSTTVVLFDALNACDSQYLEPLVRLLQRWKELTPDWLRLVATATNRHQAIGVLKTLPIVELADLNTPKYEEFIQKDIQAVLRVEFDDKTNQIDSNMMESIIESSENRIIYSRLLKIWTKLSPESNPFDTTIEGDVDFPVGLNALYSQIFRSFKNAYPTEYLAFLAPLMAARVPLPLVVWRECCPEIPEGKFNEMMSQLSIILTNQRQAVFFSHRSVFEWLRKHKKPEIFLAKAIQQRDKYKIEIFSGHLVDKQDNEAKSEGGSMMKRLGKKNIGAKSNIGKMGSFEQSPSVRFLAKRKKSNDDLLIRPQLGHRALAKWCWSNYRRAKKNDHPFVIKNIIFHLVMCRDEETDLNRDKDASTLLKSFSFNLKRLLGVTVIEEEHLVDAETHSHGYSANVSGALNDAFNVYLKRHPEDRAVRIVQTAINNGRAALSDDPRQLASQLLARIDFTNNQRSLGELHKSCIDFDPKVAWWRPVTPTLGRADVSVIERITDFKKSSVKCVVVTPDGSRVVACSQKGTIKVFETNRGRALFTLVGGIKGAIVTLDVYQEEGRLLLAAGGADGMYRIWDLDSGTLVVPGVKVGTKGISNVAFRSPPQSNWKGVKKTDKDEDEDEDLDGDGNEASDAEDSDSSDSEDEVDYDDTRAILAVGGLGGKLWFCDYQEVGVCLDVNAPVTVIDWNKLPKERNIVAVGNSAGVIHVYDFSDLKKPPKIYRHTDRVWDIRFHPVQNFLLSCSDDETVILWDVNSSDTDPEKKVYTNLSLKKKPIMCLNFSPDGYHFAAGTLDGKIVITQTLPLEDTPQTENTEDAEEMKPSEVGNISLTKYYKNDPDAELKVLKDNLELPEALSAGKLVLEGHTQWLADVAFFPHSERLVSASKDGMIIFWSYDLRDVFNNETRNAHKGDITVAQFSPDNVLLATGAKDKSLIVWEVKSGKCLYFRDLNHIPKELSFSLDGTRLKIKSDQDTICINTKNGREATQTGQFATTSRDSMAPRLSKNDFITFPLNPHEKTNPVNDGIPFTTDLPRRGSTLLTNGARKKLKENPRSEEVYGVIVTRNQVNIVQLVTSTQVDNIQDDESE